MQRLPARTLKIRYSKPVSRLVGCKYRTIIAISMMLRAFPRTWAMVARCILSLYCRRELRVPLIRTKAVARLTRLIPLETRESA